MCVSALLVSVVEYRTDIEKQCTVSVFIELTKNERYLWVWTEKRSLCAFGLP